MDPDPQQFCKLFRKDADILIRIHSDIMRSSDPYYFDGQIRIFLLLGSHCNKNARIVARGKTEVGILTDVLRQLLRLKGVVLVRDSMP